MTIFDNENESPKIENEQNLFSNLENDKDKILADLFGSDDNTVDDSDNVNVVVDNDVVNNYVKKYIEKEEEEDKFIEEYIANCVKENQQQHELPKTLQPTKRRSSLIEHETEKRRKIDLKADETLQLSDDEQESQPSQEAHQTLHEEIARALLVLSNSH